jgi:hypothetical protein
MISHTAGRYVSATPIRRGTWPASETVMPYAAPSPTPNAASAKALPARATLSWPASQVNRLVAVARTGSARPEVSFVAGGEA